MKVQRPRDWAQKHPKANVAREPTPQEESKAENNWSGGDKANSCISRESPEET